VVLPALAGLNAKYYQTRQLQNSVSFTIGYAVSRPTGYETAVFSGRNYKTEVLQFPQT
jgi:hypothetical protein